MIDNQRERILLCLFWVCWICLKSQETCWRYVSSYLSSMTLEMTFDNLSHNFYIYKIITYLISLKLNENNAQPKSLLAWILWHSSLCNPGLVTLTAHRRFEPSYFDQQLIYASLALSVFRPPLCNDPQS